jgi:hypothetical protein
MSQVVASRYNAMASSRYAGLGAPSLNQVDLTARQRELRNTIVADVLQEYSGMAGMEAPQKEGDLGGFVAPPKSFSEAELRKFVPERTVGPMRPRSEVGRLPEIGQAEEGVVEGKARLSERHQRGTADLRQSNALTNGDITQR